jgi:hypothetical protein
MSGMMDGQTISNLVGTFDGGGKRTVRHKKARSPHS